MSTYFFASDDPVSDAVADLGAVFPDRVRVSRFPLFVRAVNAHPDRRVTLVSGGGSGHEPLHTGFVGQGMLDAAVPGQIFASPHNRQIYEASVAAALPGGIIHIVKNYTGDVINFGIAAERLAHDGIAVRTVLVDDDLATDSEETATGRRGTGATVIVEKLLGAAADRGDDIDALETLGQEVAAATRSIAVASRAQTSPATGDDAFTLEASELEYGVGIHGERGRDTIERPGTPELLERLLDDLLGAVQPAESGVLLFVNGLGSTTALELHGIHQFLHHALAERDVSVAGSLVGGYVAALDMHGFSVTITAIRDDWLDLWLAPTATPAFPALASTALAAEAPRDEHVQVEQRTDPLVDALVDAAESAHERLTALDQATGDGDFGDNLRGGLRRAQTIADTSALGAVAQAFLDDVGGSSGPLLGLLFQKLDAASGDALTDEAVGRGLKDGLDAITRIGGAAPGDRTLVDALAPAAEANDAVAAARAAIAGALTTADLTARHGRASYVGDRAIGHLDPGAVGTAILIATIAAHLRPDDADDLRTEIAELLT